MSDFLTNGAAEVFLIVSKQDATLLTTVSQQLRVVCSLTKHVSRPSNIVPVRAERRYNNAGTCSSVQSAITGRVLAAGGPMVRALFRSHSALDEARASVPHGRDSTQVHHKQCEFKSKLIGGICWCVSASKNEFSTITDADARLHDPRLTVAAGWGLYN